MTFDISHFKDDGNGDDARIDETESCVGRGKCAVNINKRAENGHAFFQKYK